MCRTSYERAEIGLLHPLIHHHPGRMNQILSRPKRESAKPRSMRRFGRGNLARQRDRLFAGLGCGGRQLISATRNENDP